MRRVNTHRRDGVPRGCPANLKEYYRVSRKIESELLYFLEKQEEESAEGDKKNREEKTLVRKILEVGGGGMLAEDSEARAEKSICSLPATVTSYDSNEEISPSSSTAEGSMVSASGMVDKGKSNFPRTFSSISDQPDQEVSKTLYDSVTNENWESQMTSILSFKKVDRTKRKLPFRLKNRSFCSSEESALAAVDLEKAFKKLLDRVNWRLEAKES